MKLFYRLLVVITIISVSIFHAKAVEISPKTPESLQLAIDEAIQTGLKKLIIPPGVYKVPSLSAETMSRLGDGEKWHLYFKEAKNLEVIADGVTLIFTDRFSHEIKFAGCQNVTFRGATLTREILPFTQGKIESVDADTNTVIVRIDKGYPTEINDKKLYPNVWFNLFDPQGEWLTHLRAPPNPKIEQLESGLFKVQVDPIKDVPYPVVPGLRVALRGAVLDDIRISRGKGGLKFIDITVKGAGGMAYHEMGGLGGTLFKNCKVLFPPLPQGAVDKPIFASCADGLHCNNIRKGPIVEDCYFEGLDDDAIAIHGFFHQVVEATGNKIIIWRFHEDPDKLTGSAGDTYRFYDVNGAFGGEATVTEVKALPDYKSTAPIVPIYRVFDEKTRAAKATYIELTLDKEVPARNGWLAANVNGMGEGFVIKNCVIKKSYARGILTKAPNGIIEGCTMENLARGAIEFLPEMTWWCESDYTRNVIVRNNIIRNAGTNRKTGDLRHPGALTIFCYRATGYVTSPNGHENIVIENNTFENNDGVNILVTTSTGVVIRKNKFINPMKNEKNFGRDKGVDPESLVWITHSSKVQISDNVILKPGPFMKKIVTATPTADGTGFDDGIKVISK